MQENIVQGEEEREEKEDKCLKIVVDPASLITATTLILTETIDHYHNIDPGSYI